MGVHRNIDYYRFPEQGSWLNKRCRVFFNYNVEQAIEGIIVRDDIEEPGITIIRLDDGSSVSGVV